MYSKSELYSEADGIHIPVTLEEIRNKGIEIEGENIFLRPLRLADAPLYFQLIEDDREHLKQFGDKTAGKYETLGDVENSIINPDNPFKLRFGIWDSDQMVGSINIEPIETGRAEIGYWVGKRFIRQGYGSRAISTLFDFAVTALGYEEVEAHVEVNNIASQATVVKNGFTPDGRLIMVNRHTESGDLIEYVFGIYTKTNET